ncbi:probable protein ABIL4 isoform X1 [Brachypodium distachyon]|uniref:probable protein ABIL4 isoform X1 n=1 Tax=Brachypodium distachyon TaxID=15368 RepID=UPI0001C71D01|nr:probable protein ABIL4 isoform X1 [Brachypodium distachyon]|eukprot:XP_010230991.1 probable protein ABIL4 isoform X1 [Brachypodium distachyon]
MQQEQPTRRRGPAGGSGDGGGGWAGVTTTVDEASMERSKSFIKALQELKNLRPQLYSASEYCEKSYLHTEQKQMVLDNLKDYAVRAVVNAVDHLGTVAYKLTDLFEQQASEISTFELKVARLNQQIFTCQIYVDKEGVRQQQMMTANMKHHKHYILPSTSYKRTQAVAHLGTSTNQESKPRPYPSAKTLSWHLASDNSALANGAHKSTFALGDTISSKISSDGMCLLGMEMPASPMRRPLQLDRNTKSDVTQKVGAKDQSGVKHMTTFSSFDRPKGREIQKAPIGTKSMLTALFIKHKSTKMKKMSAR